jgi:hypothetical protein
VKITVNLAYWAIFTVFFIFCRKFIPALGRGLGHGQASLAMTRPAIFMSPPTHDPDDDQAKPRSILTRPSQARPSPEIS